MSKPLGDSDTTESNSVKKHFMFQEGSVFHQRSLYIYARFNKLSKTKGVDIDS